MANHGSRPSAFDYAVLALGVCAVSPAALFIREADAPALVIGAWRLTIATAVLGSVAVATRRPVVASSLSRTLLTMLAGLFLTLHFAFWIASVQQTSVLTAVALVTAQPLFIAVASGPLLGEPPGRGVWLGIAVATVGAAVMVADDLGSGGDTLQGDLFALLGAVSAAAYFLTGRRLRTSGSDWLSYVTLAYATAAAGLVALALIGGDSLFGYDGRTYVFMLLLALVPQLIGHTALNRSLGYLPAVSVTIAVLGEPVGAALLAAVFLGERPAMIEVIGAALLLGGVYAGMRASARTTAAAPSQ